MSTLAARLASAVPGPLRTGAQVQLICLGVALLLKLLGADSFLVAWLYSAVIGSCIWGLIHGGTHLLARLRRVAPDAEGGERWPGWGWMLPVIVVGAFAGYVLGTLIADALTGHRSVLPLARGLTDWRAWGGIVAISLAVAVAATWYFYSRSHLASAAAAAAGLQRQAAEAQLRLLQSQLEPHMLFNTLANLRVLIGADPPRAQAMLDRLIAFLRSTLAASRSGEHALADEFQRLADYLALIEVRMGPRLQVRLDLPEDLRAQPVPALLLQPLVENAVQHGLEPQVAGGRIEVGARRDGGMLVLTVRDTGAGMPALAPPPAPGHGFGLTQVRERLAALHGAHAALTLAPAADAEGGTQAEVRLPLQRREDLA